MDPLWITIAFVCGFLANCVRLPPLVGFLAAGFVLNAFDVTGGEVLHQVADLGVTLLLFSIGLKLKVSTLLKPEVWAGATLHMIITVGVFGALLMALAATGFSLFAGLGTGQAFLIAFGLSFSSTVFAVKVLDEKGEGSSLHGRVAIGILIMQDLFAVIFLTLSMGKYPSPWAFLLLLLIPGRHLFFYIMDRCRHGELLVLFGMVLALVVGSTCFELVGLKADLGALLVGILLAGHGKASEMAKSLLEFKNLFLVGFFLTIGLSGTPDGAALCIALLLAVGIVFKGGLFFLLFPRFKLRARTSLLASFNLSTYSEFGLLVGAVGVVNGWIPGQWLVIIALALSLSFVIASPLNRIAHRLYGRYGDRLRAFERKERHPDDLPVDRGDADMVIFGMGRVGAGAYDTMRALHGDKVIGVDYDAEVVADHKEAGRKVVLGDATDLDFWEKVRLAPKPNMVKLVMLAMAKHEANIFAVKLLKASGYAGRITATALYDDEVKALKEAGAHEAYNLFEEAGTGFADHVIGTDPLDRAPPAPD